MASKLLFRFDDATGSISGPAEYVGSPRFAEFKAQVEAGRSAVINCAPPGVPVGRLIEVAFQTDYAGWLGLKTFAGNSALAAAVKAVMA